MGVLINYLIGSKINTESIRNLRMSGEMLADEGEFPRGSGKIKRICPWEETKEIID